MKARRRIICPLVMSLMLVTLPIATASGAVRITTTSAMKPVIDGEVETPGPCIPPDPPKLPPPCGPVTHPEELNTPIPEGEDEDDSEDENSTRK